MEEIREVSQKNRKRSEEESKYTDNFLFPRFEVDPN